MRKKGIPEVLVRSVMSLQEGAKTRVRVDSELSEEFEVKVGMHQGSVLSSFLLAVVVDVVTEFAKEGALGELLYADDLVLLNETIEDGLSKSKVDPCGVCYMRVKANSICVCNVVSGSMVCLQEM